jgi:hypothetical protein
MPTALADTPRHEMDRGRLAYAVTAAEAPA